MEKISVDLAIIAAGPAGLCASVAAAESGVEVAVFEKSSTVGGTANMGMGPFGVESRIQKRTMGTLRKEEAFKRFMDYVHWQSDANLVHDYIWNSGPTIDWLEDMGVKFAGAMKNFPTSEATWHVVMPEDGSRPGARSASAMNKKIFERGQELGVKYYLNTPVQKLLAEGKKVTGLIAKSEDGTEYEVSAKAVIIATGGFGTNPEMVKEYTGYTLEKDMFDFMVPGIVGDGIKMAWEIGAGHGRMEMERTGGMMLPGAKLGAYPQSMLFNNAGAIAVNKLGYRCCDESVLQNSAVSGNIINYQKDRNMFRIMSSSVVKHYRRRGIDFPNEVFHDDSTEGFEEEWPKIAAEHPTIAYVADSVEELAEKMEIPVDVLVETIERYNEQCEQNYDDDFCKRREYLIPLKGDKYYALRYAPGAYGSLGGIKINHKLQVITDDYEVIEGLYGAGSDVCELYNGTYYFYFPGNTMGFAVTSGRMAGEYAADYILGQEDYE